MITKKYYKLIRVSYADSDVFRVTNVSNTVGTLTVTRTNSSYADFEYSTDGVTWTSVTDWTNPLTVSVPIGGNVYMKGNGPLGGSTGKSINIKMDVNHSASGNVASLADKTNYASMTTLNQWIAGLFRDNTHLTDASELNFGNITTINTNAMQAVFYGCTSLTTAPDLSGITTVGDYSIQDMFRGCTSLTTAPDLSGITTVGNFGMTNMFNGCTSLTTAPDLIGITTVGTTSIASIFYGCTSLTTAYAPNVSTWGSEFNNWLNGVAASGTLYCPSQTVADAIPDNSANGCPSGWTKVVA